MTFVLPLDGKILQKDHLRLTKHIWHNHSCILMSSFAILSHNFGLCFRSWEKRNKQSRCQFFFCLLQHSVVCHNCETWLCFFIHDYVDCCLETFYSREFPTQGRMRGYNAIMAVDSGSSGCLKGHFHPNNRNASNSYIKRKTDITKDPSSMRNMIHHLNHVTNSHPRDWDTDDFIGWIRNYPEVTLSPQNPDDQRNESNSPMC